MLKLSNKPWLQENFDAKPCLSGRKIDKKQQLSLINKITYHEINQAGPVEDKVVCPAKNRIRSIAHAVQIIIHNNY